MYFNRTFERLAKRFVKKMRHCCTHPAEKTHQADEDDPDIQTDSEQPSATSKYLNDIIVCEL